MSDIKQISVTFEWDSKKETVSKLNCFIDGVPNKKKTTTKAKKEVVLEDEAIVTLEANKIVFNNKAANTMDLEYQNRIIVKYEKLPGVKKPIPIVGKDISFDEEGSGNLLTKTNSISCRGKQNTILSDYGTKFYLENYKEGIWKLISDTPQEVELEDIVEKAEEMAETATVFTLDDQNKEIEKMNFKL